MTNYAYEFIALNAEPTKLGYHVASLIVPYDSNPELADYDNPKGEVFADFRYIVATDENGNRWSHSATAHALVTLNHGREIGRYTSARIEALCDRLNATKPQINPKRWVRIEPAYGSPAWQEEESLIASKEKMDALFDEAMA